jgi:type IV secretion system protein VirD4
VDIIHASVKSLINAAILYPRWVYGLWYLLVVAGICRTEEITGFWPKLRWGVWYCFAGTACLVVGTAVARWALPGGSQIYDLIDDWVSALFVTHFWWSLLAALLAMPVIFILSVRSFISGIEDLFGLGPKPIEAPESSGVHGTADIATDGEIAAAGLTGGQWGEGIRLGYDGAGKPIRYLGPNSVCLIGPAGAGKTTDFFSFLMAEAGDKSMVVIDPACQITPLAIEEARKRGRVIVIAPYRELLPPGVAELLGPTDSFNVMADLDPQSETFAKKCDTFADILVPPDTTGEGKEAGHFTDGARGVVSGVIMGVKLYYPLEKANLAEVCNIICSGDRIFKFAEEVKKRGNPHVLNRLSTVTAANAKQSRSVADILQTARLKLKFISDPGMHAVLQTPSWRCNDLKDGDRPTMIFLCIAETMVPHCGPFMGLFLSWGTEALLSTPNGKRQAVFVVDEFPLLGKGAVSVFSQLFSVGRKHGVQAYVCAQNYGQIEEMAGHLGAENLTSGCGVQVYLAPRDQKTAEHISKLAGRRTVVTQSVSYSERAGAWRPGFSFPEHGQPVFDPHQVKALGRDHFFMFAPGLVDNVIVGRRKPYWLDKEVLRRCGRDPYAMQGAATAQKTENRAGRRKKSFLRWLWEV